MAVIGDILVKFVADFAEFSEGMQKSQAQLADFSSGIEKHTGAVEKMIGQFRELALLSAAAYGAKQLVDYVTETSKAAAEQEKLAKQLHISTDEVQALQRIAKDTGNTFEATARYYSTHRAELKTLTDQFRDTGKLMSGETVKAFADISREMDVFGETVGRVRQQMQGGTVNSALSLIAKMIHDAGESLAFFNVYKGTVASVRELMAIFTGAGGLVGLSAQERALQRVNELAQAAVDKEIAYKKAAADAAQKIEDANRKQNDAVAKQRDAILQGGGAGGTAAINSQVQAAQAQADEARAQRDLAIKARDEAKANYEADIKLRDEANKPKPAPTIPTPGTSGGGGRTDAESIDAQIKRYEALQTAAQRTFDKISGYHATNIEDFQREVRVQQQVEEAAAKLGAKYSQADDTRKEALRNQIRLYEEAKDANARLLESAQRAVDIERRYGDGSAQAAKTQRDLTEAKQRNIATTTALTRVSKAQQEADEQARLEAKRYDDDLGSLIAGFEHAANAYQRSNDLFSQGAQVFNSFTNAMGEGLDALTGKSNKTFGQIASDFALMLAKMALNAATSSVFKWAFGALGLGDSMANAGMPNSSFFGPVNPAAVFGGARATGGDVYPGMSYDVGERGPERFVPTVAGRIEPMRSSDNTGSVTVNLDMGQTQGTADPSAALEFGRRVRAAVVDVIAQEKRPGGTLYRRANA